MEEPPNQSEESEAEGHLTLRPKLTGGRFDAGGIPLDFLPDLKALEDLVKALAKEKFRTAKGLERARGFPKRLRLVLHGVEKSCAVPVLELEGVAAETLFEESRGWVEEAWTDVVEAVEAAEKSEPIHLPTRYLTHFNRLGKGLKDGEAVEFSSLHDEARTGRLTVASRRRLVLGSGIEEVEEDVTLVGRVHEANQTERTFELLLPSGKAIRCPVPNAFADEILEAFQDCRRGGGWIRLEGGGLQDRQGRLKRVVEVADVTPLERDDLEVMVLSLAHDREHWDNPGDRRPAPGVLEQVAKAFRRHWPDDLETPGFWTGPDQGIHLELRRGGRCVEWEISTGDLTVEWDAFDLGDDSFLDEADLNLKDEPGWDRAIRRTRSWLEGSS